MSEVNEMFGMYTGGAPFPDLTKALQTQKCPFNGRQCYKTRKSDPNTAIGICSLSFRNVDQPVLICPEPLTKNGKIFTDCLPFIASSIPGSDLYLIPEVETSVGRIDYVLSAFKGRTPVDFVPIELQTLDTTGSIWNERQRLLQQHGYNAQEGEAKSSTAALNWKMTGKTILAQLVQKSQLFSSMNKNLVLVCQTPLYERMSEDFNFAGVREATMSDVLHFHIYDYKLDTSKMKLSLSMRKSAGIEVVEHIMGGQSDGESEYRTFCQTLAARMKDEYRFTPVINH